MFENTMDTRWPDDKAQKLRDAITRRTKLLRTGMERQRQLGMYIKGIENNIQLLRSDHAENTLPCVYHGCAICRDIKALVNLAPLLLLENGTLSIWNQAKKNCANPKDDWDRLLNACARNLEEDIAKLQKLILVCFLFTWLTDLKQQNRQKRLREAATTVLGSLQAAFGLQQSDKGRDQLLEREITDTAVSKEGNR